MHAQNKSVNFICLGARFATTLLYTYIKEHPQASVCSEETNFFSDSKQFAKGVSWYESHFSVGKLKTIKGDLGLDYLASAQAASLIARTYPSARLLAVIDNPLLAVRVEYVEAKRAGRLNHAISFESFLKQNPEVLLRACYGRQLVHYFSFYSGNDFLVLLASDVRGELLKNLSNAYGHLGLDDSFVPTQLKHLIPEEEEDTKRKPGIIKRTIKGIRKQIKRFYRYVIYVFNPPEILEETSVVVAAKIALSPEMEKYLKDYYLEDVRQLSALLHRDLIVEWGFNE